MTAEEQERVIHWRQSVYDSLDRQFRKRYQPANAHQDGLIRKMVEINWRLNICVAARTGALCGTSDRRLRSPWEMSEMWRHLEGFRGTPAQYESLLHHRLRRLREELLAAQAREPSPFLRTANGSF